MFLFDVFLRGNVVYEVLEVFVKDVEWDLDFLIYVYFM